MNVSTASSLDWIKATLSQSTSNCVEVAFAGSVVLVRDSKYLRDPRNRAEQQPVICVSIARWHEFLDVVMAGGGARPGGGALPTVECTVEGAVSVRLGGVTLTFTQSEWAAFCDGVEKDEFNWEAAAA